MSPRWMIHLRDGTTLTEKDTFPHQVDSELVTSVERLVGAKTITIKKSQFIEMFFIGAEASRDLAMTPGGGHHPQILQKQWIGCYLKGSEPPIQCNLIMDARSNNAWLEVYRVKTQTPKGINAKRVNPPKRGDLKELYQRQFIDNHYSVVKGPDIIEVFGTKNGLFCTIAVDPLTSPVKAELYIHRGNVLLGFMQPGQTMKLIRGNP